MVLTINWICWLQKNIIATLIRVIEEQQAWLKQFHLRFYTLPSLFLLAICLQAAPWLAACSP